MDMYCSRVATFDDQVEDRALLAEQDWIEVARRNVGGTVIRCFSCRTMRAEEDRVVQHIV